MMLFQATSAASGNSTDVVYKCGCGTILFTAVSGSIVIKARHHGETHVASVVLSELIKHEKENTLLL